jgi:hypothetical protein
MTCYEIKAEYEQLQEMAFAILNGGAGEDTIEMQECLNNQLEQLGHDTATKLENMSKLIKNMELEAVAYKAEIDRMKPKMDSINKQVAYIKENLIKPIIQKSGKIEAGTFTLSLRKSSSVKIIDESLLAPKYKTDVIVTSVDKLEIKKDLKTGKVKGAELVESENLQIK